MAPAESKDMGVIIWQEENRAGKTRSA
jgi:hypothetical protein